MAIAIILNLPTSLLRQKVISNALRKTSAGIRSCVVRKLQKFSLTYYGKMENGKIQSKYLRDTESVDALFSQIFNYLIAFLVSLFASVIISIIRYGYVSLFFLLVIPINVVVAVILRKKIKDSFTGYRHKTEDMSVKINTMIEMMPVTKAHGLQQLEIDNVNGSLRHLARAGIKTDMTVSLSSSIVWTVNAILSAATLVFCCILAVKGVISVGDIVLFTSLFSTISNATTNVINSIPVLASGIDALHSIAEIINIDEIEWDEGKEQVEQIDGNLSFDDVCYTYPDSHTETIKNVSFNVKKGECIAIVGASGSGKTTLLNMIIGFLTPTSGHLLIDGKNINDIDLIRYRNNISVVPQNSILFSGTIKENITYGLEKYNEELLNEVLESANINEFICDLPDGINTKIGEHGARLSGGQKQRITIARALIRQPKILILDEPTSALDNISEYHVQKAIATSIEGKTTFIVAHRLSTIRNADRIIVMDDGTCVEIGTYEELMDKQGKFYQLKRLSDMNKESLDEVAITKDD